MWSSIETIHKPATLTEAWQLSQTPGTVFIGGGTYLAADRDPGVSSLIRLKQIIPDVINGRGDVIAIGAGVTLQKMVTFEWPQVFQPLAVAARQSCPSQNIRNQRSIAGELCQFRLDSELNLLLHALNPKLVLTERHATTEMLLNWEGAGIIRALMIDLKHFKKLELLRFAPIPSAGPFLCVAGVQSDTGCRVVVGGNVNSLSVLEFDTQAFEAEQQSLVAEHAEDTLLADHFGGVDYKRKLLVTALQRLGEALCR